MLIIAPGQEINRNIFSIFFNMEVYSVFSLESPHQGYFQYKTENNPKLFQISSNGIFSKGLKSEFEAAVVNEPSAFEPLKFYCISLKMLVHW